MPPQYDPQYFKVIEPLLPAMRSIPKLAVHDVAGRRTAIEGMLEGTLAAMPYPEDVSQTKHEIESYDGATIAVYRFAKKSTSSSEPGPAILHVHGGGMILGKVAVFEKGIAAQVASTGVQIFSVDYRLAPEHPHPTLVEDSYAGLVWLRDHAAEFNVDPKRIATMGESGGGGIAAGVTLLARDRKFEPPLAKQILIYPMLDDRNTTPSPAIEPFATWTYDDNITGWTALLGEKIGTMDVSPYAAPARAESVEGLPPTYIDVGDLDIFRDEDIKFAGRLAAANVGVEFHLYPGVPHAFDAFIPDLDVTRKAMENRAKAMTGF